jgi:hypothetical protein
MSRIERRRTAARARPSDVAEARTIADGAHAPEVFGLAAQAAEVDAKIQRDTERFMGLLDAKERELRDLKLELVAYAAQHAEAPAPPRAPLDRYELDVDAELLRRTEAAHARFEHLRVSVENLDKKLDAGFRELFGLLHAQDEARRRGILVRGENYLRRNGRAALVIGSAVLLVLLGALL